MKPSTKLGMIALPLFALAALAVPAMHYLGQAGSAAGIGPGRKVDVTVSSGQQLVQALTTAGDGSVIRLMAGTYPDIALKNIIKSGTVIIESADAARPARLSGMNVLQSEGLHFRNLAFAVTAPPTASPSIFYVAKSRRITLSDISITGPDGPLEDSKILGLFVRLTDEFTVTGSRFRNLQHAISLLDNNKVEVTNNQIAQMRTDGVRGGGLSDLLIAGNTITDFSPAKADHADGIQLWSTNQKEPGRNIVIRDNLISRGKGGPIQGIFIRDTHNVLPFENLEVSGNMVIGGVYHGITIIGVNKARVTDNDVIAMAPWKSWIRLQNASDAVVQGNRTSQFTMQGNTALTMTDNRVSQDGTRHLGQRLAQWLDRKPGRRVADNGIQARILTEAASIENER
ncbi:right-handed parallel beta-helix repeat-containing protein [Sphingobium sufflavum]|uniref:right-handed parallel beta-helix repeat-containing protein n=1 Tax=Sphingobium sufflavum TaxID=1129547 RepID=UPI001F16FBA8|nr:right-handed parallel beta-helix repeat-containing protein [Sphingobium sufflavum]MCE7798515.1 right-handed parallel beta-helix repeat-containing protein [Sphingobium sufflavum]